MITIGYQQTPKGHCLRELATPTRPSSAESELRAMALILAPWAVFALVLGVFG